MQMDLVDGTNGTENLRKYALDGLTNLLKIEADLQIKAKSYLLNASPGQKVKKSRNRIKNGDFFITSRARNPQWDKKPNEWAKDWCSGWAVPVSTNFANALGIELTKRIKTIYPLDENGKKIPCLNEHGEIEKTKSGKIRYKAHTAAYLMWTQSTAFNFKTGYVLHTYCQEYADKTWGEQIRHNPFSIKILEGNPASPVDEAIQRDKGFVRFQICRRNEEGTALVGGEIFETTLDGFIEYLITGELP